MFKPKSVNLDLCLCIHNQGIMSQRNYLPASSCMHKEMQLYRYFFLAGSNWRSKTFFGIVLMYNALLKSALFCNKIFITD